MSELLDNAVWHALQGPQATLAEQVGRAARFRPSVCLFAALPDDVDGPDDPAWDDLAALVGAGRSAVLLRGDGLRPPAAWTLDMTVPVIQMQWRDPDAPPSAGAPDAVVLGPADVDEMLDLVRRTEPGPFERETIRMGTYLGVRDGGRLVAMAGERTRTAGAGEVSGVCTDVDHQGRGLAGALVLELVERMLARGERPFLHAMTSNHRAIGLYEHLGFEVRTTVELHLLRAPERRLSVVDHG